MLTAYEELSGFRPQEESDVMLRMKVLAGELYNEHAHADYILRQMFPTTAEGEYLDAHAAQRNLSRKGATVASGNVIFKTEAETHGDIVIPAGTVVSTTEGALRFVTDKQATLASSAQIVSVPATADQPGAAYNVTANTVNLILTPVPGIDSVYNNTRFSGGTDTESDELLRERIAESYRNISNGTNAAYYRSVAMAVDGVYSASVVGGERGAGTVNVYVMTRGGTLPAYKLREVQALMDEARELNVDVQVLSPTVVNVNLYIRLTVEDGYVFADVANEVRSAVSDYITSLGIGGDVLLSEVGEIVYHIKGVRTYKFLESYGSDCIITDSQYPKPVNVLVRAE